MCLANHVTSPSKKMHVTVINTTERQITLKKTNYWASNRIRRVHRKHKCHKNYDLSANNLECGHILNSHEKAHHSKL